MHENEAAGGLLESRNGHVVGAAQADYAFQQLVFFLDLHEGSSLCIIAN